MATPEFGAPIYGEHTIQEEQPSQSAAAAIDPNDPRLTSEAVDEDVTADAYAVLPVPPDGKWRAKGKLVDIKDPADGAMKKRIVYEHPNMNDGKPFFCFNIESSLIDVSGKFDGMKLTDYWVKTQVDKRKNISQTSTITKVAGGAITGLKTEADRATAFEKTLAGEPEYILDTVWKAECQTCQDAAKKKGERAPRAFIMGMTHFPQMASKPGVPATYDPVVKCPTCGSQVRAQLRIAGYLSVKEAKATRGIA